VEAPAGERGRIDAGTAGRVEHGATGTEPLEQIGHCGPGDRDPVAQRIVVVEPVVLAGQVKVVVSHETLACNLSDAARSRGPRT
jgi:hypothetical protein